MRVVMMMCLVGKGKDHISHVLHTLTAGIAARGGAYR